MTLPLTVDGEDSARDALLQLQAAGRGLAVVLAADGSVAGTVGDGGIRRAAMSGIDLDAPVSTVLDADPALVGPDATIEEVRGLLLERVLPEVAVMDDGRVTAVRTLAEVGGGPAPATAVVLAGGRGQRLAPLTDKVPKPLLTVGSTTILERLLHALGEAGVEDVYLSVNYKAELFEDRLGDGSALGLRLRYLREHKALNTAGPLTLLPSLPDGPLLVCNADQVTALHLGRLVEFHRQEGASVTVGAFEHDVQVPYGVLRLDGGTVTGIEEKPILHNQCNAGLYVLEPSVVRLVPRNTFFGMPSLVGAVLADGGRVAAFPILETFIDIGTREELDRALLWFATGEDV